MLFYSNLFTGKCIIYPLFIRLLLLPKKRKLLNTACLKPVPIVNPFSPMYSMFPRSVST